MNKKIFLTAASLIASISTPIIANATCTEFTATNSAHISAGRASVCSFWYACAVGSNENLGMNNAFTTTTLKEDPAGYFAKGTCPEVTGEAPEIGSWGLVLGETEYTPSNIEVTDVDGDLDSLIVRVTNDRTSIVVDLDCDIELIEGSTTEYKGNNCDTFTVPQWGNYTHTPIATDVEGNVAEGESSTQMNQIGSSAPILVMGSYSLDGTVLTVTGTTSDIDGDVARVVLGVMPVFGIDCEGTTTFTCTMDTAEYFEPGTSVGFTVNAYDSVGNSSNFENFVVEVPQQHVPTIDTHEYSVDGNTITFTGTASDVDGDLDRVLLTLGAAGGIVCEGAASFTCTFEAPRAGTYVLGVVAIDATDAFGEVAGPYEFIIEASTCIEAVNSEHITAGRAYEMYGVLVYATGSDIYLGITSATTTLEETSAGVWDTCQ